MDPGSGSASIFQGLLELLSYEYVKQQTMILGQYWFVYSLGSILYSLGTKLFPNCS